VQPRALSEVFAVFNLLVVRELADLTNSSDSNGVELTAESYPNRNETTGCEWFVPHCSFVVRGGKRRLVVDQNMLYAATQASSCAHDDQLHRHRQKTLERTRDAVG